jgi:tetratricopeptide (TPR) repeat protein
MSIASSKLRGQQSGSRRRVRPSVSPQSAPANGGSDTLGTPAPADVANVASSQGPTGFDTHTPDALGLLESDDATESLSLVESARVALWAEYEETGDVGLLDDVVQCDEEILALCPVGHTGRAHACEQLSVSLRTRSESNPGTLSLAPGEDLATLRIAREAFWTEYQETSHASDLEEVIGLDEQILDLCVSAGLDRAGACMNLGASLQIRAMQTTSQAVVENSVDENQDDMNIGVRNEVLKMLWGQYQESGDPDLLDRIIIDGEILLGFIHEGHPFRGGLCANLAMYLDKRHEQTADPAVLDQIICLRDEACALFPPDHPHRESICANLGKSLQTLYHRTKDVGLLHRAAVLFREALALTPPGHPRYTASCTNLAVILVLCAAETSDPGLFDEGIRAVHQALALLPPGHPSRTLSCSNFATLLMLCYAKSSSTRAVTEAIALLRQALAAQPPGHPDRASTCSELATALGICCERTNKIEMLTEATELQRKVLELRPLGHPDHATTCANLAISLIRRYERAADVRLLTEATQVLRDALALSPIGHPSRADLCSHLAYALKARYELTADSSLLNDAIALYREALSKIPPDHPNRIDVGVNLATTLIALYVQSGATALIDEATLLLREAVATLTPIHPQRAKACANLSACLGIYYMQTGNVRHSDEGITLVQEALELTPPGHPDRAGVCENLAFLLKARYGRTGDMSLLDTVTGLEREALALCSPDHPRRASTCAYLAITLNTRYDRTGDVRLLDEAIALQREALALRPVGHFEYPTICDSLANALRAQYKRTGEVGVLDEAIQLERETLRLRPPGHTDRAVSCENLANFLTMRYEDMGEPHLSDEATQLLREALRLRPPEHTEYAGLCLNLSISLDARFSRTGDGSLLEEAIELARFAGQYLPPSRNWRSLATQCGLYLKQFTTSASDFAPLLHALQILRELSRAEADDIGEFMTQITSQLGVFWSFHAVWGPEMASSLVSVYSEVIDRLPLMAGFVLTASSQLLALRSFSALGLQACVAAIEAGDPPKAIELLDHAHGVIWAQALHQRDPQLGDVPPELASELEGLLHAVAVPVDSGSKEHHLTLQDVRHVQNSRIQSLLGEIRALRGLNRFMRGSAFNTLRQVARDHPVVVLVAVDEESYAVIISSSLQDQAAVLKLDVTTERIVQLRGYTRQASNRNRASEEDGWRDAWSETLVDAERVMRPGGQQHSLTGVLRELWKAVVKPVFGRLGIEVIHLICAHEGLH